MNEDLIKYYRDWPMHFAHDIKLVGVINTSPDSYFSESFSATVESAVESARRHIKEGAAYVEVGGLSGGSAAKRVSVQEEIDRTAPIVRAINDEFPQIPITIDSFRSEVVRAGLSEGATAINDVTALEFDPSSIELAAESGAQVFLMYLSGPSGSAGRKLNRPFFEDAVGQIRDYFEERIQTLTDAGIDKSKIVIDVGLGAGKRPSHDYMLLARLEEFSALGVEQMSAVSRKQFVEAISAVGPDERLGGSIVGALWSVLSGAKYLRVHEVRPYAQMLDVWNGIMSRYLDKDSFA